MRGPVPWSWSDGAPDSLAVQPGANAACILGSAFSLLQDLVTVLTFVWHFGKPTSTSSPWKTQSYHIAPERPLASTHPREGERTPEKTHLVLGHSAQLPQDTHKTE